MRERTVRRLALAALLLFVARTAIGCGPVDTPDDPPVQGEADCPPGLDFSQPCIETHSPDDCLIWGHCWKR